MVIQVSGDLEIDLFINYAVVEHAHIDFLCKNGIDPNLFVLCGYFYDQRARAVNEDIFEIILQIETMNRIDPCFF